MANKKGIVLFITLMFILAISALITKNLTDANKYIEVSNNDIFYTKSLIGFDNLQKEFLNYFIKQKDELTTLLENESFKDGISFSYGDMKAKVYFQDYSTSYDLNKLKKQDILFDKNIESFFLENNVLEFVLFKQWVVSHLIKYGDIRNFTQINTLVDSFVINTQNSEIREIQDKLSFIDSTNKLLILGKIELTYENRTAQSSFIYDIKSKKIEGLSVAF